MAEGEKIASELVKALAKQVYDDVAAHSAKEIGGALGDLMHAMRVSGLELGYITRERATAILERALSRIPKTQRMLPPPQIVGPVFEGLRYEPDDTTIAKMFEELLSASMDKSRFGSAHPSYPNIIRQLSTSEALLLMHMDEFNIPGEVVFNDGEYPYFMPDITKNMPLPDIQMYDFYIDHLTAFGFVATELDNTFEAVRVFENGRAERAKAGIRPLGRRFIRTCRPKT